MRKINLILCSLLVALILVGFGGLLEAQKSTKKTAPGQTDEETLHDIQQLEQSLREAFLDGKSAWWDLHLDDHYAGLNPDGVIVRKADLIQLYNSTDVRYDEVDMNDMAARIYDNCVIASGKSTIKGSNKGQDFSGDYYFVHVWAREGSEWKLANSQATKLPG